ncbi:MAG TPA: peptidylprolyl isomerase [Kiritimatiellia bacterium]|nr:peptidylprolyl isomerase [Kiritimatiellia bacterium]HNR94881.1 peptidylprolyl isomerase [Kiritimatiellia bacterium]HNS80026.1 peptidylprolyl isomerase [Kiritimatiellia bacterium]HPA77970.1 peptidylprolyl isomerase [Kiritimatiellia bacterium]HQQ03839.1 peptidylprolyl isomerase [Kiritimatiellia bacterium]
MDNLVLVTVNNESLTREEARRIGRDMAARQGIPPQMIDKYLEQAGEELEKHTVEQFINQALIKEEVDRRAVPVSEEEIGAAVAELERSFPEGMTLDKVLVAQGVSRKAVEEEIIRNERVRKLYETETAGTPSASDEQVSAFYQANRERFRTEESAEVRHILIGCKAGDDPAVFRTAKEEAAAIREQLLNGADFGKLAAEKSACPSGKQGGSLGDVKRGQMVPAFEEAVFSQTVGEIGPVVTTEFGCHVVQVTARNEAAVIPEEDAKESIREHLSAQAKGLAFEKFVAGLRGKARITYGGRGGGIIIP